MAIKLGSFQQTKVLFFQKQFQNCLDLEPVSKWYKGVSRLSSSFIIIYLFIFEGCNSNQLFPTTDTLQLIQVLSYRPRL